MRRRSFRIDGALQPAPVPAGLGSHLYFQVSDHFAFDEESDFELIVRRTPTPVRLEFDSWDTRATLGGAYTACRPVETRADGDLVVEKYRLSRARFANRQNGAADFRFVLHERTASIRELTLRRVPR